MTQRDWYEEQHTEDMSGGVDEQVEQSIRKSQALEQKRKQLLKQKRELSERMFRYSEIREAWDRLSDVELEFKHERERISYNLGVKYGLRMRVAEEVLEGTSDKLCPQDALHALLHAMLCIVKNMEDGGGSLIQTSSTVSS